MGKRELSEQFINSAILLVKIQNHVKDNFFYGRFTGKIFAFGLDFLEFSAEESGGDIVQCQVLAERCFADIFKLTDALKEFRYLELVKSSPLLLKAEYNLLTVKFGILKRMKELLAKPINVHSDVLLGKKEENRKIQEVKPKGLILDFQKGQTSASLKIAPRLSYGIENQKLTPSKRKILEYLKSYPNTRTKDIIYEFSALSGRSVKRNLTDLLRVGLVRKRVDSKAVYYYANDGQ